MDFNPFTSGQWQDALAGGLGGAVKAMSIEGSWLQRGTAVVGGAICALYLAPLGDSMLETTVGRLLPTDRATYHLGGFLFGVIGLGAVGFIMGIFKKWTASKGVTQ